jgi:hypothetical protein
LLHSRPQTLTLSIQLSFLPEGSFGEESPKGEKRSSSGSGAFGDYDVELSLCGEFFQQDIITPWDAEECLDIFYKYQIPFDDFWFNSAVINDPNVIVRINGRMYRSSVAFPFLLSLIVYRKPPSSRTMKNLIKQAGVSIWTFPK